MNDQASAGVTVNHANIVFLTHSGADSGAEQSMVTYLSRWPRTEPRPLLLLGASGAIEPRAEAAGLDFRTLPWIPRPEPPTVRRGGSPDWPPPSSACCGTPRRYGASCGSGRPTWSSRSASSHWCSAGSPDDAPVPRWSGACTTGSTVATSPGSWCRRSATSSLGWSTGSSSTAAPRWPRSGPAGRRSSWPPRPSRWTRATSTRPATRYAASSCSRGCRRGRARTCSCAPSPGRSRDRPPRPSSSGVRSSARPSTSRA